MYVGRFSYNMTQERFAKKYECIRADLKGKQYKKKVFRIYRDSIGENDYEKYINEVLRAMRDGHREYVYTWKQLRDLLLFEYDRLHVYFHSSEEAVEVWLE